MMMERMKPLMMEAIKMMITSMLMIKGVMTKRKGGILMMKGWMLMMHHHYPNPLRKTRGSHTAMKNLMWSYVRKSIILIP